MNNVDIISQIEKKEGKLIRFCKDGFGVNGYSSWIQYGYLEIFNVGNHLSSLLRGSDVFYKNKFGEIHLNIYLGIDYYNYKIDNIDFFENPEDDYCQVCIGETQGINTYFDKVKKYSIKIARITNNIFNDFEDTYLECIRKNPKLANYFFLYDILSRKCADRKPSVLKECLYPSNFLIFRGMPSAYLIHSILQLALICNEIFPKKISKSFERQVDRINFRCNYTNSFLSLNSKDFVQNVFQEFCPEFDINEKLFTHEEKI